MQDALLSLARMYAPIIVDWLDTQGVYKPSSGQQFVSGIPRTCAPSADPDVPQAEQRIEAIYCRLGFVELMKCEECNLVKAKSRDRHNIEPGMSFLVVLHFVIT